MRIGTKGRPFYRIVVVDERKKRTGSYIDLIGTYNPLSTPKEIKIDQEKVEAWTKKGAQMSTGFLRITGKAHQRPEGKIKNPGKLRSSTPAAEESHSAEATRDEATPAENVAVEEETTPETSEDAAVEEEVSIEAPVAEAETVVEETAAPEEEPTTEAEAPTEDSTDSGPSQNDNVEEAK